MTEQSMTKQSATFPVVGRLAKRFEVDDDQVLQVLLSTVFRTKKDEGIEQQMTTEHLMGVLLVADQYGLDPFRKEIYAFPDGRNNIVPVVSVDGWARLINEHQALDGIEFEQSEDVAIAPPRGENEKEQPPEHKPCPIWIECIIHRKDRSKPVRVREYFDECYRAPFQGKGKNNQVYQVDGPWQSHPKRMLRHKALIQCARVAFSFTGLYDRDEAERIVEGQVIEGEATQTFTGPDGYSMSRIEERARQLAQEKNQEPLTEEASKLLREAYERQMHNADDLAELEQVAKSIKDDEEDRGALMVSADKETLQKLYRALKVQLKKAEQQSDATETENGARPK